MASLSSKAAHQPSNFPIDELDLKSILLQIPGGVVILQAPSVQLIYHNEDAATMFRYPALHTDAFQSFAHSVFHPNGRRYLPEECPITRAFTGETVKQEEILYRRGDRTLGHFLINAVPIRHSDGTVAKVLCTFFDISVQRETERILKETQKKLDLALSGADLALWGLDITTGVNMLDEKPFTLFGYQPGEMNSSFNAWLNLMHPEDKAHALDQWYAHLEGKTPLYEVTARLRTANGEWKWALLRGQVTERDHAGKPLQAAGTVLDIDRLKRTKIALRESEEKLRLTLQCAAIGIATVDVAGRWLSVNPKIVRILGYTENELLEHGNIKNMMHADDCSRYEKLLDSLVQNEKATFIVEQRYFCKDGKLIWVNLTASGVYDVQRQIKYLIHIIEDKTAQKQAEEHLLEMQARLRMATNIARIGFSEWNAQTGALYFSPEWKAQLGYSEEEFNNVREEWESRVHPEDRDRILKHYHNFLDQPFAEFIDEYRMRHKDGSFRWINLHTVALFDDSGKLSKLVSTHQDITEQKRTQEIARQSVQHDALTGLPNRSLLYEFSEHLFASARRSSSQLAVLFFDLDRFKAVNDNYGHNVGDGVLQEVANRLNQLMRAEDVISRLGGDEFVAILSKVRGQDNATSVATKALESLTQPYLIEGFELRLSPSIGISLFPKDGDTLDELIQKADAAMYNVKNSGCGNYQFFSPAYSSGVEQQDNWETRLRSGLEHNEFDLYYQPVLDTSTDAVIGVEALLRWPCTMTDTQIDPSVFIPIAENSGLILPLGEWIFFQACRQHQLWIEQGLPALPVAIHVSPVQFRKKDFTHTLDQAIVATGINPSHLELQITETMVMKDFDNAANVLHVLKQLGLKIILEGVGTGNSNLQQLSQLPIDKLKVARSLVSQLSHDKSCVAITEMILTLGRALGIDVIAEGIESEHELTLLQAHHCYHAQGYHLGRPMPADQFSHWYKRHASH
jgi:diguanylate cyclase (GGDEF)-like protein/PAS domain S-box-containing protein